MPAAASYLAPGPKQLDIVEMADAARVAVRSSTSVAHKNRPDLSAVSPIANGSHSSTCRKKGDGGHSSTSTDMADGSHSSTALKRIEARRKSMQVSRQALCVAAGIHINTYRHALEGHARSKPETLGRLKDALDRLSAGTEAQEPRTLCLALLRLITADFSKRAGWDPQLMLSQSFAEERPQDPVWLQASRMRRCAVYVLVEGLFISKAAIGKAIGHSRQAVHKTVAAVEMERDRDPAFDAVMQAMMDTVKS